MSDITPTLTAEQRAARELAFDATKARLITLAGETGSLVHVDTDDNLAAAKAARARLQKARTTIEKTGKAARDDANKFSKAVIAKERELLAVIKPEEDRLADLVDAEERRREDAARELREAEQRRVEALQKAFARIRSLPGVAMAPTLDLAGVDRLIDEAQAVVNDQSEFPEDMQAAARYEGQVALAALKAERDRRVQVEADRAELERLRKLAASLPTPAPAVDEAEAAKADVPEQASVGKAAPSPAQRGAVMSELAQERERLVRAQTAGPISIPTASEDLAPGDSPLLAAARDALAFLEERGYGSTRVTLALRLAIDDVDSFGVPR